MQWVSTRWPDIAHILSTGIEEAAEIGKGQVDLFAWRTEQGWDMSWEWPPDESSCMVSVDESGQRLFTWEGSEFCVPQLAQAELAAAGYFVDESPVQLTDWVAASEEQEVVEASTRACDARKLTIRWDVVR